ncbi:putative methyltransferase NSUN7 [Bombina bombina]|uniref:putative methyltransferase NSUN7 n=1 Tax=Bombina bombina TaxID=8345 RepID=UPI00235AAAE2|nr:putative methyltransferase NSUN7 [Bombina bombina]
MPTLQSNMNVNSARHSVVGQVLDMKLSQNSTDSIVRGLSCLTDKVNYPDPIFVKAAAIYQNNHVKKPPDRILVKYGTNSGTSVPDFKDERYQRWSYELAFSALKYQDLLETILLDSGFFHFQPLPDELASLVVVMLYDFQDRKFEPRYMSDKEEIIEEVREVERMLYSSRTKLAAALARSRIKYDAPAIEYILPEAVRKQEKRASTIPLYAWINTAKTNDAEVFNTLKTEGFTKVKSPSNLEGLTYVADQHCHDLIVFPPHLKDDLSNLELFINHKLVLQSKAHSLAVHSVKSLMNLDDDIIVVNPCSGFTAAHMSVLTNQSSCNIFVCGVNAEEREEELQQLFGNMQCQNIKLLKERFIDIDPTDQRLQKAKLLLLLPHCSGSGVSDPIEFILNEYGDTGLLQDFSQGIMATEKLNDLAKQQLTELTHAMKFNKVQAIVYCTSSVYQEENENVINQALAQQVERNKLHQYRLSPPVIPLSSPSEIISASNQMFKMEPSETANGLFIAVMVRERHPPESVTVKDVLARAAAKGLLEGLEVSKPINKQKEGKTKKGKAVAQKHPPTISATQTKIAEFLKQETSLKGNEKPSTSVEQKTTSVDRHFTSHKTVNQINFQNRKPSKEISASALMRNTNNFSSMLNRQANVCTTKAKSDDKVRVLKPVRIMLPPVTGPCFSTQPAVKLRNPANCFHQRWHSVARDSTHNSFVQSLSKVVKSREALPSGLIQHPKPWL